LVWIFGLLLGLDFVALILFRFCGPYLAWILWHGLNFVALIFLDFCLLFCLDFVALIWFGFCGYYLVWNFVPPFGLDCCHHGKVSYRTGPRETWPMCWSLKCNWPTFPSQE
jgi:hypothetical protein